MSSTPGFDDLLNDLLSQLDNPDPPWSDNAGDTVSASNGLWNADIHQIMLSLGEVKDVKAAQDLANQLENMRIWFGPEEQPVVVSLVTAIHMIVHLSDCYSEIDDLAAYGATLDAHLRGVRFQAMALEMSEKEERYQVIAHNCETLWAATLASQFRVKQKS